MLSFDFPAHVQYHFCSISFLSFSLGLFSLHNVHFFDWFLAVSFWNLLYFKCLKVVGGICIIHIILQQILHDSQNLTWILFFINLKLFANCFKFVTFDEQQQHWAHIGCKKTWISLVLSIWWPQLTLCLIQNLFCLHLPYFSVIILYFIVKEWVHMEPWMNQSNVSSYM